MRNKKYIIMIILAVLWCGLIFYMSSQTGEKSGNMSEAVTKKMVQAGEKIGIIEAGTSECETTLKIYDGIVRKAAHFGSYFLLTCFMFAALRVSGVKIKKSAILCFVIGLAISILDEINQMNFAGRNNGGEIREGIGDIFIDSVGISIAITLLLLSRAIMNCIKKNKKLELQ